MDGNGQPARGRVEIHPRYAVINHDFEFRFEVLPFMVNQREQNPENARIINALHDRTLDALYEMHDKTEQAMAVSQATFDALASFLEANEDAKSLIDHHLESNIFGGLSKGDDFLEKLKMFKSKWIVFDSFYTIADMITGRVSCSDSDQMIHFMMRWQIDQRHFVFTKLNHITDDSAFPPPIFGRELMPINHT